MDCSPPGFSVHGISQARILEWIAISFSRGSSWPRDHTCISCIGRRILYHRDTWEALVNIFRWAYKVTWASLVAQLVKNLPAMQEIRVWSPGSGRSPGGGHGSPPSVLAWRIRMDRGAWHATVHGSQRVGHDWETKRSTSSNTAILTEDTELLFTDVSVIYWCV